MLDVLSGVVLLMLGYYAGKKSAKPEKPSALEVSSEEKERARKNREDWERLLDFGGDK